MALENKDLSQMQSWGREYALSRKNRVERNRIVLQKAAEYLVLADNELEYDRLLMWWLEGVRNNVSNMYQYDMCRADIIIAKFALARKEN